MFLAVLMEERREKRKGRKLASTPQRTDRKPSFLPPSIASYPWSPTDIALQQVYNPELLPLTTEPTWDFQFLEPYLFLQSN